MTFPYRLRVTLKIRQISAVTHFFFLSRLKKSNSLTYHKYIISFATVPRSVADAGGGGEGGFWGNYN